MLPNNLTAFDDRYVEACFYAWYSNGHPKMQPHNGGRIMKLIPSTADGRRPSYSTLKKWMLNLDWSQRADVLDAQVSIQLDKQVVKERVKTLQELAAAGEKLMTIGMEYLEREDPFNDNPAAAVRAIIAGAGMKFQYSGAADRLAQISDMNDKQIEKEILMLLGKENEDDDTVDAEAEEVSSADESAEDDNA